MSAFIPLLVLSGLKGDLRSRALNLVLPTLVPGPQATKLAIAAFTAEREVKQAAATEQKLVTEAIKAAGITSADALAEFPALNTAFNKLPAAVKSGIFSPAVLGGAGDREVALSPTPESGTPAPAPGRGRSTNQPTMRPTP